MLAAAKRSCQEPAPNGNKTSRTLLVFKLNIMRSGCSNMLEGCSNKLQVFEHVLSIITMYHDQAVVAHNDG